MKLLTTTEAAKRWGTSVRRIALLCSQARVKGAEKVGNRYSRKAIGYDKKEYN